MSKKNLLVDRYSLTGQSATVRKRSWPPAREDRFASHPSFKLQYGALPAQAFTSPNHPARNHTDNEARRNVAHPSRPRALDPFRGAMGRYWGFKVGGSQPNYADFGYLNQTSWTDNSSNNYSAEELEALSENNVANLVSVKIVGFLLGSAPRAEDYSRLAVALNFRGRGFGEWLGSPTGLQISADHGAPEPGDWVFGPQAWPQNPAHVDPYTGVSAADNSWFHNLSAKSHLTIAPDAGAWSAATTMAVNEGRPVAQDLNVLDQWSWEYYVGGFGMVVPEPGQGGSIGDLTGIQGAPSSKWSGLWGLPSYAGYIGMSELFGKTVRITNGIFYDHAHQYSSPVSLTAGSANATAVLRASNEAVFSHFSRNYEHAIMDIDERLLPNAYILLNYINEWTPDNPDTESINEAASGLDNTVTNLYTQVACLGSEFSLPTTHMQIADSGYEQENTPYIQKFYSKLSTLDTSNLTVELDRAEHIGFAQDFWEETLAVKNSLMGLPMGIGIEFDTRIQSPPAHPLSLAPALDEIPGAHDFLLQNIMMMNISGTWDAPAATYTGDRDVTLAPTGHRLKQRTRGRELFEVNTPFSAEISHLDNYAYYGFDWAAPSGKWGKNVPESPQPAGWQNRGPYNLKTLDLAHAIEYALYSRLGPSDNAQIPSTMVGPTTLSGVAFGKGMFIGRSKMATAQANDTSRTVYENNPLAHLLTSEDLHDLVSKLASFIYEKRRNYLQMINGELAYNETIAFRVAKHKVASDGSLVNPPIQNFYFSNLGTINKIKYMDTQVKYGQKYVYKVYAYNLVVGSQYNYQDAPPDEIRTGPPHWNHQNPNNYADQGGAADSFPRIFYGNPQSADAGHVAGDNFKAEIDVNMFPSVQIIEAPYYTYDPIEVRDLPPVFPEVEVVPFRGVNDKIRLLLQTQNVKYAFNPDVAVINDSDIDNYNLQRTFQGRPTGDIVFGSDDTDITFEIYRMTTRPTSYRDFDGWLLDSLPGVTPSGRKAVNIGYDDTIQPNKKYYYTFRTIDYHSAISIPSPIYIVEIVDDNGRMYPIIDIFYMGANTPPQDIVTKPLRKYLQVAPALHQTAVNMHELQNRQPLEVASAPGTGLLGSTATGQESVWSTLDPNTNVYTGTIFKIRLNSTQTGKKIDLNVRFLETSTINPEEQD